MNITDWSVVSAYGVGRAAFIDGILDRRPTATLIDQRQWHVPDERACLVPDFDPRIVLGEKGTRSMDRVTGLAVTAIGALLADNEPVEQTALVLGTTAGSAQFIPNTVMNCAAAQCAIRHSIDGPNTTLACGRPSGLLALAYARRLLLNDRARTVLCGGAEEYSTARSWLEHHSRGSAPALLGEGAALIKVQASSCDALATVLALDSRVRGPGVDVLSEVVQRVLARSELLPSDIWAAVPSGVSQDESLALTEIFGAETVDRLPAVGHLLGDTGAVASAFQLAAVLAVADQAPGEHVLITSVDPDGLVAAAVLRLGER